MEKTPDPIRDRIRADILEQFHSMRSTTGFALTVPWIREYQDALGSGGEAAFEAVCTEMAADGLLKYRRGPRGDTVAITRHGVETIYPEPDPENIRAAVLGKFKEIGAREGYVLPEMWLQRDYERGLNEREQEIFQETVRDMASEGLVEYVARPAPNLKITAFGLQRIEELKL